MYAQKVHEIDRSLTDRSQQPAMDGSDTRSRYNVNVLYLLNSPPHRCPAPLSDWTTSNYRTNLGPISSGRLRAAETTLTRFTTPPRPSLPCDHISFATKTAFVAVLSHPSVCGGSVFPFAAAGRLLALPTEPRDRSIDHSSIADSKDLNICATRYR